MLNTVTIETESGVIPLTESRVKIKLPGIERRRKIVHISDSHISVCRDGCPSEEAEHIRNRIEFLRWQSGLYYITKSQTANRRRVEPCDSLDAVARRVRELSPDVVIMTGDVSDEQSETILEECIEYKEKLGAPVIISAGNRDHFRNCTERQTELRRELYGEGVFGGVNVFDMGDFDIVSVDDAYTCVSAEQCDSVERLLSGDRKVILCQHVPFLSESVVADIRAFRGYGWMIGDRGQPDENIRYVRTVSRYAENVAAVLAGHVHITAAPGECDTRASIEEIMAERCDRNWEIAVGENETERKRFCDVFLSRSLASGETEMKAREWLSRWDGNYDLGGVEEYVLSDTVPQYVAAPAFSGFLRVIDIEPA